MIPDCSMLINGDESSLYANQIEAVGARIGHN